MLSTPSPRNAPQMVRPSKLLLLLSSWDRAAMVERVRGRMDAHSLDAPASAAQAPAKRQKPRLPPKRV
jgi:hypothetical protein